MEGNKINGVPSTPPTTRNISSPPPRDRQLAVYANVDAAREAYGNVVHQEFPTGYRFTPTDHELLQAYLHNKVLGRSLPMDKIKDVEIYRYNPHDLADMFEFEPDEKKECYFFTPRDRKYPNGTRPNRAAGDGYWKATGADKTVKHPKTGEVLGYKKALVFYHGKPGKGTKTNWIQHEYRIEQTASLARLSKHNMKLDDWVLVRIYEKKPTGTKGKRNAEDDDAQVVSPESSLEVEHGDNLVSPHPLADIYHEDNNALLLQGPSIEHAAVDQLLENFIAIPCNEWNMYPHDLGQASTAEACYSLNTVGPVGSSYGMFQEMDFGNYYITPQELGETTGDEFGLDYIMTNTDHVV